MRRKMAANLKKKKALFWDTLYIWLTLDEKKSHKVKREFAIDVGIIFI